MFYTTEIKVLKSNELSVDEYGISEESPYEIQKTLLADVQPYSSELAYRDFGYHIQCTKRIFCDNDSEIMEGSILEICGCTFKVMKIIEWDIYMELMANEKNDIPTGN